MHRVGVADQVRLIRHTPWRPRQAVEGHGGVAQWLCAKELVVAELKGFKTQCLS